MSYSKDRCFLEPGNGNELENEVASKNTTVPTFSFPNASADKSKSQSQLQNQPLPCIPSPVDFSVCLEKEKSLKEILEEQEWTQKRLMKEFHSKNFFNNKSKVLERYAFYRGALYTTDAYFSVEKSLNPKTNVKEDRCKLYHVCGGLPWQVS